MGVQKEREAFSRWVLTHPDNRKITAYEENIMFDAWQASKAQAIPDGFVVVPKEPTDAMLDAGMRGFYFPLDNGRFYTHDLIFAYRAMLEAQEPK